LAQAQLLEQAQQPMCGESVPHSMVRSWGMQGLPPQTVTSPSSSEAATAGTHGEAIVRAHTSGNVNSVGNIQHGMEILASQVSAHCLEAPNPHVVPVPLRWLPLDCVTVGSLGHGAGTCNKPCFFINSRAGCQYGKACLFCHGAHPRQKSARPTKQVRDECMVQAQQLVLALRTSSQDVSEQTVDWKERFRGSSPRTRKYMKKVFDEAAEAFDGQQNRQPQPPFSPVKGLASIPVKVPHVVSPSAQPERVQAKALQAPWVVHEIIRV